jgi:phosphoglycolate phosphatase
VFKEYYAEHCAEKTKPYEGILPLLQALKEKGVQTAVLSNKVDFAVKELAKTYFDGLLLLSVGENEALGIRKKPMPDALFSVMKTLQAEPQTTLYVGDSEVDIQTAKNAGIDCLCVTWGFRTRAFLEAQGGKIFVDHPKEILSFC